MGHKIIVIYDGHNTLTYAQIALHVLHIFLYLLLIILINQKTNTGGKFVMLRTIP